MSCHELEHSAIGFAMCVCLSWVACGGASRATDVEPSTAGATGTDVAVVGPDLGCGPGSGTGASGSNDPVRADAEQHALRTLDWFVGRFVSGKVPVYRGTVQAHDNTASAFGAGNIDGDIPLGSAIADLQLGLDNGPAGQGDSVFIFSPSTKKYLQLHQPANAPGTTQVFMILDEGTSGGRFDSCLDCAPRFADLPPTIVLDGVSGRDPESGFATTVSTSLARVSGCSLTFEELLTLDSSESLPMFERRGDEFVLHLRDSSFAADPSFATGTADSCRLATGYTIDLFVNASQPWRFGFRNFVVGEQYTACPV